MPYKRKGHRPEAAIYSNLEKNPRLRPECKQTPPESDRLFKVQGCATVCAIEPSNLVPRHHRTKDEDNVAIYNGLIASADQLMKSASVRDRLAAEKDILYLEIEAAGLMNHLPCLVIRGIRDYSDTHKNKEWHGYAAVAAAAYAKDLLCRIAPNRVKGEKKIGDVLSCNSKS
ncbi:hypothetical protein QQS21_008059 [Conoideocrella luteorostrata]|uniref:Nucleoside phosphorylase domain-containing protein n=1 Tax=Conoideocrella luteorostrata TaxID=1105319 RepID=A0AAJ0CMA9_9HYPO|nr:hypothetical protein QQS21_008059 [Conoideocrella luteorostrata]